MSGTFTPSPSFAKATTACGIKAAFTVVDLTNTESQAEGFAWWEALTGRGGEGMVVKPIEWLMRGKKGLVQPAVKYRGKEYLRIIYGAVSHPLSPVAGRKMARFSAAYPLDWQSCKLPVRCCSKIEGVKPAYLL